MHFIVFVFGGSALAAVVGNLPSFIFSGRLNEVATVMALVLYLPAVLPAFIADLLLRNHYDWWASLVPATVATVIAAIVIWNITDIPKLYVASFGLPSVFVVTFLSSRLCKRLRWMEEFEKE